MKLILAAAVWLGEMAMVAGYAYAAPQCASRPQVLAGVEP